MAGCATYPNQYGYEPVWLQQRLLQQRLLRPARYYGNGYNGQPGSPRGADWRRSWRRDCRRGHPGRQLGRRRGRRRGSRRRSRRDVNGRQYYRDTRGYCYYVDQYGQPHYNYNVRCYSASHPFLSC